jgi:hypothetical protein
MFEPGRPLTDQERKRYAPYFAEIVLDKARIFENKVPFWLRKSMCAVVVGHRVYMRPTYYNPNTAQGVALLGHELTHVSQFLHGMTILKYLWSCRYGYANSLYEKEAYAKGHIIAINFKQ